MKYTLLLFFGLTFFLVAFATKVTRVIDGDTFQIETGERVRLIGINAPELSDIYGKESKDYLAQLIEGKDVELQDDNLSSRTDRYNRLLKYVYLKGEDINNKIILNGYAIAYLKYNFEKKDLYKNSQLLASKNSMGLWNNQNANYAPNSKQKSFFNAPLNYKNVFIVFGIILLLIIGLVAFFKK